MRPIPLMSLTVAVFLLGCNGQTQATIEPKPSQSQAEAAPPLPLTQVDTTRSQATGTNTLMKPSISTGEAVMLQGTVRYLNLEGGFWGIVADNGKQILPKNLPQEYHKDGLRLSFIAQEITGMMTIQQWGTLSSLSEITVIGQVESKAVNPEN